MVYIIFAIVVFLMNLIVVLLDKKNEHSMWAPLVSSVIYTLLLFVSMYFSKLV